MTCTGFLRRLLPEGEPPPPPSPRLCGSPSGRPCCQSHPSSPPSYISWDVPLHVGSGTTLVFSCGTAHYPLAVAILLTTPSPYCQDSVGDVICDCGWPMVPAPLPFSSVSLASGISKRESFSYFWLQHQNAPAEGCQKCPVWWWLVSPV